MTPCEGCLWGGRCLDAVVEECADYTPSNADGLPDEEDALLDEYVRAGREEYRRSWWSYVEGGDGCFLAANTDRRTILYLVRR